MHDVLTDEDPSRLTESLLASAVTRPWLRPLAYLSQTLELVVRAVVLLVTNWRLILVEIVPAVWIAAITWDWRARASGRYPLPEVYGWVAVAVFVGVIAANVLAYWCNVTIAFTLMQPRIDLRAAFASARRHATVINTWAVVVGACHACVSVFVSRTTVGWFTLALGAVALVQMYALVALPAALVGARRAGTKRSFRDRASMAALTGTVATVAAAPGFLLNRLALLVIAVGLRPVGVVLMVVAVLVQIAGTSSAHAVSLATKVTPAAPSPTRPTTTTTTTLDQTKEGTRP